MILNIGSIFLLAAWDHRESLQLAGPANQDGDYWPLGEWVEENL